MFKIFGRAQAKTQSEAVKATGQNDSASTNSSEQEVTLEAQKLISTELDKAQAGTGAAFTSWAAEKQKSGTKLTYAYISSHSSEIDQWFASEEGQSKIKKCIDLSLVATKNTDATQEAGEAVMSGSALGSTPTVINPTVTEDEEDTQPAKKATIKGHSTESAPKARVSGSAASETTEASSQSSSSTESSQVASSTTVAADKTKDGSKTTVTALGSNQEHESVSRGSSPVAVLCDSYDSYLNSILKNIAGAEQMGINPADKKQAESVTFSANQIITNLSTVNINTLSVSELHDINTSVDVLDEEYRQLAKSLKMDDLQSHWLPSDNDKGIIEERKLAIASLESKVEEIVGKVESQVVGGSESEQTTQSSESGTGSNDSSNESQNESPSSQSSSESRPFSINPTSINASSSGSSSASSSSSSSNSSSTSDVYAENVQIRRRAVMKDMGIKYAVQFDKWLAEQSADGTPPTQGEIDKKTDELQRAAAGNFNEFAGMENLPGMAEAGANIVAHNSTVNNRSQAVLRDYGAEAQTEFNAWVAANPGATVGQMDSATQQIIQDRPFIAGQAKTQGSFKDELATAMAGSGASSAGSPLTSVGPHGAPGASSQPANNPPAHPYQAMTDYLAEQQTTGATANPSGNGLWERLTGGSGSNGNFAAPGSGAPGAPGAAGSSASRPAGLSALSPQSQELYAEYVKDFRELNNGQTPSQWQAERVVQTLTRNEEIGLIGTPALGAGTPYYNGPSPAPYVSGATQRVADQADQAFFQGNAARRVTADAALEREIVPGATTFPAAQPAPRSAASSSSSGNGLWERLTNAPGSNGSHGNFVVPGSGAPGAPGALQAATESAFNQASSTLRTENGGTGLVDILGQWRDYRTESGNPPTANEIEEFSNSIVNLSPESQSMYQSSINGLLNNGKVEEAMAVADWVAGVEAAGGSITQSVLESNIGSILNGEAPTAPQKVGALQREIDDPRSVFNAQQAKNKLMAEINDPRSVHTANNPTDTVTVDGIKYSANNRPQTPTGISFNTQPTAAPSTAEAVMVQGILTNLDMPDSSEYPDNEAYVKARALRVRKELLTSPSRVEGPLTDREIEAISALTSTAGYDVSISSSGNIEVTESSVFSNNSSGVGTTLPLTRTFNPFGDGQDIAHDGDKISRMREKGEQDEKDRLEGKVSGGNLSRYDTWVAEFTAKHKRPPSAKERAGFLNSQRGLDTKLFNAINAGGPGTSAASGSTSTSVSTVNVAAGQTAAPAVGSVAASQARTSIKAETSNALRQTQQTAGVAAQQAINATAALGNGVGAAARGAQAFNQAAVTIKTITPPAAAQATQGAKASLAAAKGAKAAINTTSTLREGVGRVNTAVEGTSKTVQTVAETAQGVKAAGNAISQVGGAATAVASAAQGAKTAQTIRTAAVATEGAKTAINTASTLGEGMGKINTVAQAAQGAKTVQTITETAQGAKAVGNVVSQINGTTAAVASVASVAQTTQAAQAAGAALAAAGSSKVVGGSMAAMQAPAPVVPTPAPAPATVVNPVASTIRQTVTSMPATSSPKATASTALGKKATTSDGAKVTAPYSPAKSKSSGIVSPIPTTNKSTIRRAL